jgi:hypothetical protein
VAFSATALFAERVNMKKSGPSPWDLLHPEIPGALLVVVLLLAEGVYNLETLQTMTKSPLTLERISN